MVQLLAIRVASPGTDESQITAVRWYNPDDGQINVATTEVMVQFLTQQHGVAYIYNGRNRMDVIATPGPNARLAATPPAGMFFQTEPTLLSLPRF
jgi:hypothetical protein